MQKPQSGSVAVLGAGAWGTALAILLAKNGQQVGLWDHDAALLALLSQERRHTRYLPEVAFPDQLFIRSSLEEALNNADTLVVVVPSQAFALLLAAMQPLLRPVHRIVWQQKVWNVVRRRYCIRCWSAYWVQLTLMRSCRALVLRWRWL